MYHFHSIIVLSVLIRLAFFLSAAQDQSNIYPSHSYHTSLSPPPHSVSPPTQEDLGGPGKNGTQEHSVVNFTTATSDTITIHPGKPMGRSLNQPLLK